MSLKFGLSPPQGWTMELATMKDPVEAYETMTQVAQLIAPSVPSGYGSWEPKLFLSLAQISQCEMSNWHKKESFFESREKCTKDITLQLFR
jgi:hypothetical protein